jgi:acetyltransferase-like isoleucine patch superfamily enzyme
MGIRTFLDEVVEQGVTLLPDNRVGIRLRCRYWSRRLAAGSAPRTIGKFSLLKRPEKIFIGRSVINNFVTLDATYGEGIRVGDQVLIGPYTVVVSYDHGFADPSRPIREQECQGGRVTIDDDVWIGAHCIITCNVTIGRGSVIGAGSVVTHDIPPGSIAHGSPARVVGHRGGAGEGGPFL